MCFTMAHNGKRYTEEFKRQIIDLYLAGKAVENACLNVSDTSGIILHSDLGIQYTSDQFESHLAKKKIHHSSSRKGCPYDNSCI